LELVDQVVHGQVVVDQELQLLKEITRHFLELFHQVVVEVEQEITLIHQEHLEDLVVEEVELIMALQQVVVVMLEDLLFQKVMMVEEQVHHQELMMQQEQVVEEPQLLVQQVQHHRVVDQKLEEQVLRIQLQDLM
tara:strand:+ start:66 stop:470 length:405 start_codon:yes stop_codon:yes gene_type:complete